MREPTIPPIQKIMAECRNMPIETLYPFMAWMELLIGQKRDEWYSMQRGLKVRQDGTVDNSDL